ncbi:MAG TPA: TIGR01777 family oxidoreductase [Candidatus Eisenbacteria bacterium]|nr:TIGR01777 family oxidoreductase [Candidatus Eisenbacteria bacterium]
MHVLVSGSSGFLGSALMPRLAAAGHRVTRLVRSRGGTEGGASGRGMAEVRAWAPDADALDPRVLEGIDAVIHLGGASIGSVWTSRRKELLRTSRVRTTRLLAERIASASPRPAVFAHASAVGYYGDRGDEVLTEASAPGRGFLADLCRDWEAASMPAQDAGARVVRVRAGLVLSPRGGVLPVMLRPFRLGLGGRLGSGRQWMPWIALEDAVAVYLRALEDGALVGAVNAVAPEAVTNAEFTRSLARAVRRPSFVTVPAFALGLLPGGMGKETLLASERVVPKALQTAGFRFESPTLETALSAIRGGGP